METQTDTGIKRERNERWSRASQPPAMRLTERDAELVEAVWQMRYCTCDQLTELLFTPSTRSSCQRRLTLLWQHRFLDKLPGRTASEPDVYFIGRGARAGIRLLRTRHQTADLLRRSRHGVQLEHTLAINSLRCRVVHACRRTGLELSEWRDSGELAWLARTAGAVPDGYFVIRRQAVSGSVAAAFFLELERSPRSPRTMTAKYRRLVEFYASGAYEEAFRRRSLRLLVVTSAANEELERRWADRLCNLAGKTHLGFGLFASLSDVLVSDPDAFFDAPTWRSSANGQKAAIGGAGGRSGFPERTPGSRGGLDAT